MPTKPTYEIQTSNTQAKSRKLVTVYDQHKSARFPNGRPWWGYAEMPAERGAPWGFVGSLAPGNHLNAFGDTWEAPWLPDDKWLQPNVETGKLTINYGGMVAEYTQATRTYYEKCAEVAHENKWIAPTFGGHVDSRFRAVVGRDVPQSPKIPQAAMAGDPWLLGVTTEINEGLHKILKATTYGSMSRVIDDQAVNATTTVAVTPDIQAMIDKAVAAALAAQTPDRSTRTANMRDAKQAKKAQAQGVMSGHV
jgi:cytosine/adenosine deaminase-related metal-dependent hydrolase